MNSSGAMEGWSGKYEVGKGGVGIVRRTWLDAVFPACHDQLPQRMYNDRLLRLTLDYKCTLTFFAGEILMPEA